MADEGKRALVIGVGGSGKSAVTMLKERLEETYGQVPDHVVLLSIDTDSLRDTDQFSGTKLSNAQDAARQRDPEYLQVTSPGGMDMTQVFADIRGKKTEQYMNWLEHNKLDMILSPTERDIRGGAQQRRPVGRVGLFLRYQQILNALTSAISKMYGEAEAEGDTQTNVDRERGKRLIFIVSSVAGGTGSGMFLDVANLTRAALKSNMNWTSVDMSAVIVLPDAFSGFTSVMEDPTNLKPNSYAALRELDRFMRVHNSTLPYTIRYSQGGVTYSDNQLFDHVYLVDTASRSGTADFDLGKDPYRGVFPAISDFVMGNIDHALGDEIATQRSNAGQWYAKTDGRLYSSFNVYNYIFPLNDVVETFTYRYLRDLLTSHFLTPDVSEQARLTAQAADDLNLHFSAAQVASKPNNQFIQKMVATTRRFDPETPMISWGDLLSVISLTGELFENDQATLSRTLQDVKKGLVSSKDYTARKETTAQGYERLLSNATAYDDDLLGPRTDETSDESRRNGLWDRILGGEGRAMGYLDTHRQQFMEILDAYLLELLNTRDTDEKLLPYRLAYAKTFIQNLRDSVTRFRDALEKQWQQGQVDARRRQAEANVRTAVKQMETTRNKRGLLGGYDGGALDAQTRFKNSKSEYFELALSNRLYRLMLDLCDTFGNLKKDRDSKGRLGVLNLALQHIASWDATMSDVDKVLHDGARQHENDRTEKNRIKVRKYLTSPELENGFYKEMHNQVQAVVLGVSHKDQTKGMQWVRRGNTLLTYNLETMWQRESAVGAEEIAQEFFEGTKGLFNGERILKDGTREEVFDGLQNQVRLAERVVDHFNRNASALVGQVNLLEEPFLRFNPSLNGFSPHSERYVAVNVTRPNDTTRVFFDQISRSLREKSGERQAIAYTDKAESTVALTILELARGIKLEAVDQFNSLAADYRQKLTGGVESIHLFPEEQNATDYESRIHTLNDPTRRQRTFEPELVIGLGKSKWVEAFVEGLAYGLVKIDDHIDKTTGTSVPEVYVEYPDSSNQMRRFLLSDSDHISATENTFNPLPAGFKRARLFLDALQYFVVLGVDMEYIRSSRGTREEFRRALEDPMAQIRLFDLNLAINATRKNLTDGNGNAAAINHLQNFIDTQVSSFRTSPDGRVKDMGALFQIILNEKIQDLRAKQDLRAT